MSCTCIYVKTSHKQDPTRPHVLFMWILPLFDQTHTKIQWSWLLIYSYNEIVSADLLLLELRISFSIVYCFVFCGWLSPPSGEGGSEWILHNYLPSADVKVYDMTGKIKILSNSALSKFHFRRRQRKVKFTKWPAGFWLVAWRCHTFMRFHLISC